MSESERVAKPLRNCARCKVYKSSCVTLSTLKGVPAALFECLFRGMRQKVSLKKSTSAVAIDFETGGFMIEIINFWGLVSLLNRFGNI